MENFRLLSEELGVSLEDMVLSKQVHSSRILRVYDTHRGMVLSGNDPMISRRSDHRYTRHYAGYLLR